MSKFIDFPCPYDGQNCPTKELAAYTEEEQKLKQARKTRSAFIFCSADMFDHSKTCPLSIYDRPTCVRYMIYCVNKGKKCEQQR